MSQLPALVAEIAVDHVRLAGDTRGVAAALKKSAHGGRVYRDPQLRLCLRYESAAVSPLENIDLVELLAWLNNAEVAFAEAYDQAYGPAELMRALQAAAQIRAPFHSIVIRAADDWLLMEHV